MRLNNANSVFNMGDTSIRVKQLVEVNRVILSQLYEFSLKNLSWDPENQEKFYYSFINKIKLLEEEENIKLFTDFSRDYSPPKPDKVGLRGRTLTNALVKNGFVIDSDRKLGEAALHYLNNELKAPDSLERLLGLDMNNLLYLRQYLKLRIYAYNDENQYFYNFRFSIAFLEHHDNVPKEHFLKIIESINPNTTKEYLNNIIIGYEAVKQGGMSFNSFYKSYFLRELKSLEEITSAKKMFENKDFSDENFKQHFSNGKTSSTVKLYKDFVLSLINVVNHQDISAFKKIQELSKNNSIKKAFSNGKIPFIFERNQTVSGFLNDNLQNPLLSNDHFEIYQEFIFSKHNDLIREYSDMCRRAFQVTGLISFDNDLVNLNFKWLFSPLLKIMGDRFVLCGNGESFKDYEGTLNSVWFKDQTMLEILGVTEAEIETLLTYIRSDLDVQTISDIPAIIEQRRENDFRNFVERNFPIAKVAEVLEAISIRDDKRVSSLVTDNANISTIYEYILTIAWYHISKDKDFELHKTFQVSLDGNKLPLVHRGGGAGDIEVNTKHYALLIEATLMDKNTQKRGEMEPVIRHSINFKLLNENNKLVQTLFVANELDENVINIFRATQFTQLTGTLQDGTIDGLDIFPLTTDDIVYILKNGIRDHDILNTITANRNKAVFVNIVVTI